MSMKSICRFYIFNTSIISSVSSCYPMQVEYRKIQKHSDNGTLLVTIPTAFAQAIPLQKSNVVKMTLEGKSVRLEKV